MGFPSRNDTRIEVRDQVSELMMLNLSITCLFFFGGGGAVFAIKVTLTPRMIFM